MSGGPIFGFRLKPFAYWIVAIQSAWLPESRVVFGCPVPALATLLEELFDRNGIGQPVP